MHETAAEVCFILDARKHRQIGYGWQAADMPADEAMKRQHFYIQYSILEFPVQRQRIRPSWPPTTPAVRDALVLSSPLCRRIMLRPDKAVSNSSPQGPGQAQLSGPF